MAENDAVSITSRVQNDPNAPGRHTDKTTKALDFAETQLRRQQANGWDITYERAIELIREAKRRHQISATDSRAGLGKT